MSNIKVDYDILNQKQTPAFYASSLATRPAFGFPGRIFIDTDTPSSGIYRDTGSAWVQVADPGAGTTGTLQQVTTNGNTTTLGIQVQGIDINDGAGTGTGNVVFGNSSLQGNTTGYNNTAIGTNTKTLTLTGANTEVSETISMAGAFTHVSDADFKVISTRTNGGFNIYRIAITWELGSWYEPDFNKPHYSFFPRADAGGFETASETTAYVAPTGLIAGSLSRFIEITPSGLQAVFNTSDNYFRVEFLSSPITPSNPNIKSAGTWKHTGEFHSTGDII